VPSTRFAADNSEVRFPIAASGSPLDLGADDDTVASVWLWVGRFRSWPASGSFMSFMAWEPSGGGVPFMEAEISGDFRVRVSSQGGFATSAAFLGAANTTDLLAILTSWPANGGSNPAPTVSVYNVSTGSALLSDGAVTAASLFPASSMASGYVCIGERNDLDDLDANVVSTAVWKGRTATAANLATMVAGKRTADVQGFDASTLIHLVDWNALVGGVYDDMSSNNVDSNVINGTSIDSVYDPGWTFGLGQTAVVDAILDAQWTDVGATFQATAV
jgi:hypothetical protein